MELARIKEANNEITEAATILQELQVINTSLYTLTLTCFIVAAGRDIWFDGEG